MDLTRRQLLMRGLLLASGALVPGTLAACTRLPLDPVAQQTAAPATDPIDAYITTEMAKRRIPGLALAVVQHGTTIKSQGYGVANLEIEVPVRPDTVFELASVTKQFTATAIMVLAEEGRLGLDDLLSDHLPYPFPPRWNDITLRHLLTHTAGLAGLSTGFAALGSMPGRSSYSREALFDAATKDTMSSQPGTAWQYSDVGYFLLGLVIEHASDQRYQDFLAARFFQPLNMTATSIPDQWTIVKNRADGYTIRNGEVVHIRRGTQIDLPSHFGVHSTVEDLATWDNALAAGTVVKPASLAQMWTPVTLNNGGDRPYGFGWEIKQQRGHRLITHNGVTGTEYSRFPDDELTVIVLTNLGRRPDTTGADPYGLTFQVAGLVVPDLATS